MPIPMLKVRSGRRVATLIEQHLEDRRHVPAGPFDVRMQMGRQDAREVGGQPAAGDMREGVHQIRVCQREAVLV